MKRKNYKFTNRKHSERAIMSTILGIISTGSIAIVIYLSYLKAGAAPISYGLTGLLAAIFSIVGLILGLLTVQERERFLLFPILGIVLNLAALGILVFLVQLGF